MLLALLVAVEALADPASLQAKVQNGTTGAPALVDEVSLYELGVANRVLRRLDAVEGEFTLDDLDVDPGASYLLRVRHDGVDYNEIVRFDRHPNVQLQLVVFEESTRLDDLVVPVERVAATEQGGGLRVQQTYVVQNQSEPPRTIRASGGTFRFRLLHSVATIFGVSASHEGRAAEIWTAELEPDGVTYRVDAAFRPGSTELTVFYGVDYSQGGFTWEEEALYDIGEVVLMVSPSSLAVGGDTDWEVLNPDTESRFAIRERSRVTRGQRLRARFEGGPVPAAAVAEVMPAPADVLEHGTVVSMPISSSPRRGVLVGLMAFVLGSGLVHAVRRQPVGGNETQEGVSARGR